MSRLGLRCLAWSWVALALAAAVAGCDHTTTLKRHHRLRVALTEYRIDPQSVLVSAGKLTIVVHNYGRRTHNFVLSLDGLAAGATKPIWPGGSERITVYLVRGRYQMASTVLSDQALGEYGTLVAS